MITENNGQLNLLEDNAEYAAFVEKFKPKLTTDDCYTPEPMYNAIRDWACREYGVDPSKIVRPFYPGGDYEHYDYPEDCFVLDNPPFSILKQIVAFYCGRGVRFFLFAPGLTSLGTIRDLDATLLAVGGQITYENGAEVGTSFITNMEPGVLVRSVPELTDVIKAADREYAATIRKSVPKYSYPPEVVTAAMMNYLSIHHTPFKIMRRDACFIRKLDAQEASGKAIFGGGFLLSEKAAAEKAAAEKAAAEKAAAEKAAAERWHLSDREREIIRQLG